MSIAPASPSVAERSTTADTTPEPGTAERLAYLRARPVVSPAEAGELTGLSRSTLLRAIANGDLQSTKVGRRVIVSTASLLELVGAELEERASQGHPPTVDDASQGHPPTVDDGTLDRGATLTARPS